MSINEPKPVESRASAWPAVEKPDFIGPERCFLQSPLT
jgi:hypothetical protein